MRERNLYVILGVISFIVIIVFLFLILKRDGDKFGVVDIGNLNETPDNSEREEENDVNNDGTDNPVNDEDMDPELKKLIDEFKEANPDREITEREIDFFSGIAKGEFQVSPDSPWLKTPMALFESFTEYKDAPDYIDSKETNLRFYKPKLRPEVMKTSGMYNLGSRMSDNYIMFNAMKGHSLGYINLKSGEYFVIDEGNRGSIPNKNKNEYIYMKGYGDSGSDLFYDRIGPTAKVHIEEFEGRTTLISGAFYKDLVLYTYRQVDEDENIILGSGVYNIMGSKEDEKVFRKVLSDKSISYVATDGDLLVGFSHDNRALYDLSDKKPVVILDLPDVEDINAVDVYNGKFILGGVNKSGVRNVYTNVKGPTKFPNDFRPRQFLSDNLVIGSLIISDYGTFPTIYNFETQGYEIVVGTGGYAVDEGKIYFKTGNTFTEIEFETLD